MEEKNIKLLKFAISLGSRAIRCYEDVSYRINADDENDYYAMVCELAEKLGVDTSEIYDY